MSTKRISSLPSVLPSVVPPPLSCPITSSSTTSTTSTTSSTYSIPSSSSKQRGNGIDPTTATTSALLSGTKMPPSSTTLSDLYPTNDPSTQDFDFEDLFTFISLHNTTSPSENQPQRRRQQQQYQHQNHRPKHHPPYSSFQTPSPANPPAPPQDSLYKTRSRGFSYSHYGGNVNIPIPNATGHGGKETMSAAAQQLRRQVIRN